MTFDLHDWVIDASSSVIEYGMLHPEYVLVSALGALLVGTLCILIGVPRTLKKGQKMGKKERKIYVAQETADAVCDALQGRYEKGRLSRDEVNRMYKCIAHATNLWDLYPKRVIVYPKQSELKAELLARKAKREEDKAILQALRAPISEGIAPAIGPRLTMREMLLGTHA